MADDICSVLTASTASPHSCVVEGRVLDDLWITSGDTLSDDHVDVLLHRPDGSVVRLRVRGSDSHGVAGSFGRGDRVRARIVDEIAEEDVLLVVDVQPW